MKRDMELVRELLLKVEGGAGGKADSLVPKDASPDEVRKITGHIELLVNGGLLTGNKYGTSSMDHWANVNLTWVGHDFLDNTRDGVVWKKTKIGIEKLGGASWEVIKGIAVAYAKQEVKTRLGLDL